MTRKERHQQERERAEDVARQIAEWERRFPPGREFTMRDAVAGARWEMESVLSAEAAADELRAARAATRRRAALLRGQVA